MWLFKRFKAREIEKQISQHPEAIEWNRRTILQANKERRITDEKRVRLLGLLSMGEAPRDLNMKIRNNGDITKMNRVGIRADSSSQLGHLFETLHLGSRSEAISDFSIEDFVA